MKQFVWVGMGVLFCGMAACAIAAEPEWNAAAIKECDRACLVGIMDGYMNAIFQLDPKLVPPLALDVRMTENTGQMDVGEGMLWRSRAMTARSAPSRTIASAMRTDIRPSTILHREEG